MRTLTLDEQTKLSLALVFVLVTAIISAVVYAKDIEARVEQNTMREEIHYDELNENIKEIKQDVKEIHTAIIERRNTNG